MPTTCRRPLFSILAFVAVAHIASEFSNAADGVSFLAPYWTSKVRSNQVRPFPLTVDGSANVYAITGTLPSDDLVKVAPDGTVTPVNGSVGSVVGVGADLDFGFQGDLFTTAFRLPDFQGQVLRFNLQTGAASSFYSNPALGADSALAFDGSKQRLYTMLGVPGETDVIALDSSGTPTPVVQLPYELGAPTSMGIAPSGNLFLLDIAGTLTRIDPVADTYSVVANLKTLIPNADSFRSIDVDPLTGQPFFSVWRAGSDGAVDIYSINPDGTNLATVATVGHIRNIAFGPNSVGNGISLYTGGGSPGSFIYELTPHIPGDANDDGKVTGADYTIWAAYFSLQQTKATWSQGDFNGDGKVTGADYTIWAANFTSATASSLVVAPEPGAALLLLLGIGCVVMRQCLDRRCSQRRRG